MVTHEQTILSKLHDIYGMMHIPFWQTYFFYGILGILGIVLIGLCWCYVVWRRRQCYRHAWEQALYELEELGRRGLEENQQKLFYSELTRIMKEYLQKHFEISLTSKTDDELLALSSSLDITQAMRQDLQNIFEGVVFIKFAQAVAVRDRMERDLLASKALVKATRLRKNMSS